VNPKFRKAFLSFAQKRTSDCVINIWPGLGIGSEICSFYSKHLSGIIPGPTSTKDVARMRVFVNLFLLLTNIEDMDDVEVCHDACCE